MQVVSSPLFIEDFSGNNSEVQRGSLLKRRIAVKNLGDRVVEVDVWIVATNKQSEPLLRWCSFSEQNPIQLNPCESRDVILNFEIPPQAAPDVYSYEVLVHAQTQYPDKPPVRRLQQLRVLPSAQDAEWGNEPAFSLQPATNSANPHCLQIGEQLEVQVKVKNCSKRVDRYYLTCPELSKDWFTIQYPESNLETPGLVRETDGLELNPGNTGEILLILHPPKYTPAGNYFPTVRLISSNKEGLVLLDVVYLQILPSHCLEVQICPSVRQIPTEPGLFTVELSNLGNLERDLALQVSDRAKLFTYNLIPSSLRLAPGTTEHAHFTTTPKQWWRRPLWGKGFEFLVDLEVQDLSPSQTTNLADSAISRSATFQGTILWETRPWWFLLLLILVGLGAIGTLAFLLWLMLFKPRPSPPTVNTSPKIVRFENSTNPQSQQKRSYQEGDKVIYLDWQISHLKNVEKVTVVRLDKGAESDRKSFSFAGTIPDELQRNNTDSFCAEAKVADTNGLSCTALPLPIKEPGEYTFQLQVFSRQNQQQPIDSITLDTISVTPAPTPHILELIPTQSTYQVGDATSLEGLIRLNWEVSNAKNIKELKLIGLAPDGSIKTDLRRYAIVDNTLPSELSSFCTLETNLVCRNVPTATQTAGDYTFKMVVVPQQNQSREIEKSTPVIKIQAAPPKILSFQLNGQEINNQPKLVYELNRERPITNIVLSWQVKNEDGINVELLPAPGFVPLQGTLNYPLSKAPSRETLTLRVTNQLGEQTAQTIVLETVEPKQITSSSSSGVKPAAASGNPSSEIPASAPNSDQLQPIELPPKPAQ